MPESDNYRTYTRFDIDNSKLVKETIKRQISDQMDKSVQESIERRKIEDIKNRPFLYLLRL